MTASEYQSQMVPFAMELANRISLRLEHHNSLTSFEIEDIEQELLTYVLERASQFDPAKGSIEAFVTQMMCRNLEREQNPAFGLLLRTWQFESALREPDTELASFRSKCSFPTWENGGLHEKCRFCLEIRP